jgi:formate dehydrogenase subunit gamma
MSSQSETFQRFSLGERVLHVLLFASVGILALTGLPQKYSSLEWARGLADLVGGIYGLRLIHRASALVLAVGFAYYIGRGLYRCGCSEAGPT